MTSNYAESFNNKTRDARTFPVTTFVEFIRFTIQSWFAARREEVEKCTSKLATIYEKDVSGIADDARYLKVHPLGQFEFHVVDPEGDGEVNLMTKSCSCGQFQIMGYPCVHGVAAAMLRNVNIYSLCSPYYTTEMWRESYKETIYPTGNEDDWEVPENIEKMQVGVPVEKQPVGQPKKNKVGRRKTNCTPSNGEIIRKERKCSMCGGLGHNRATCKARL